MPKTSILAVIKQLRRPVFTTNEIATLGARPLSTTVEALKFLERKEFIFKVYRGIWAEVGNKELSPYVVIPYLFPRHRAYVSFVSALHLYGIIEQIPQVITLASTSHTKIIRTKIGTFSVHRIAPSFFYGFDWYRGGPSFLIAEPEKALVDSLYISARRKRQFGHFPELHFSKSFNFRKAKEWAKEIPYSKIRSCVEKKIAALQLYLMSAQK